MTIDELWQRLDALFEQLADPAVIAAYERLKQEYMADQSQTYAHVFAFSAPTDTGKWGVMQVMSNVPGMTPPLGNSYDTTLDNIKVEVKTSRAWGKPRKGIKVRVFHSCQLLAITST